MSTRQFKTPLQEIADLRRRLNELEAKALRRASGPHDHAADYVDVTGDTMTGNLSIDRSAATFNLGLESSGGGPYSLSWGNDGSTGKRFNMHFRTTPQSFSFEDEAGRVLAEWPLDGSPSMYLNRVSGNPSIKSLDSWFIMDSAGTGLGLNYYVNDNVTIANGGGNVVLGASTPTTGVGLDVANGPLLLRGGHGGLGVNLEIQDANPEIRFRESATTERNWWLHVNDPYFYLLRDSNGDGAWDTPHPLQIHITSQWTKVWNAVTMYATGLVEGGTFRGDDGTYTAPTYSFKSDTDTGMYRDTSLGAVVIAYNGLRNFTVYSSGTIAAFGHSTTSNGANTYMNSSGLIYRSTSSRRYKQNIRPTSLDAVRSKLRGISPVKFDPLPGPPEEPQDPQPSSYVGLIAEDLAELLGDDAGAFVGFDQEGRPDWIMYDRLVVPLLQQVNELTDRVESLEQGQTP